LQTNCHEEYNHIILVGKLSNTTEKPPANL